jgi:hypothetical protein
MFYSCHSYYTFLVLDHLLYILNRVCGLHVQHDRLRGSLCENSERHYHVLSLVALQAFPQAFVEVCCKIAKKLWLISRPFLTV